MLVPSQRGKRIIDISEIIENFSPDEGEIHQIIGRIGSGKTYEATRRAYRYLMRGKVVYTTWQMVLPEYYDEREDKFMVLIKTLLFKREFYKIPLRENWRYLDIGRPDLAEHVGKLTDCVVMMDEGQDIFDARERMKREGRQSITRARHLHKTLVIISQRAQAVDVTARANVNLFFLCRKINFLRWNYFKVYVTEEMDNQNYPVWEDFETGWRAPVWHAGWGRQRIYNAYNSWYLRAGIPPSQELAMEAYELSLWEKMAILFLWRQKKNVENAGDISEDQIAQIEQRNKSWYDDEDGNSKKSTKKKSAASRKLQSVQAGEEKSA